MDLCRWNAIRSSTFGWRNLHVNVERTPGHHENIVSIRAQALNQLSNYKHLYKVPFGNMYHICQGIKLNISTFFPDEATTTPRNESQHMTSHANLRGDEVEGSLHFLIIVSERYEFYYLHSCLSHAILLYGSTGIILCS